MYIVIVKVTSNDRYRDNNICIYFSIEVTIIKIEETGCSICENFLLGGELTRSASTLLKRCGDIIIFQERDRVEINLSVIV